MKHKTILALLCLLSLSCGAKKEIGHEHKQAIVNSSTGIDVSHHQGKINWKEVRNSGVTYVYLKASEGSTYTDPNFNSNLKEAQEHGILVGAYHFYSERSDIEKQFEHFKKLYPKNKANLIPMLDIEPRGKSDAKRIKKIRNDVKKFQSLCLKYYGVEPMLYIEPLLTKDEWLSQVIKENTKLCIGHPYKTAPKLHGKADYTIWQYTYSGKVNGISGSVDKHRFNKDASINDILLK